MPIPAAWASPGSAKPDPGAGQFDGALVGRVNTRNDLHQGRFAGPVLAHDGMHLTGAQIEVDVGQDTHSEECLSDAVEGEQWRCEWWRCCSGCHEQSLPTVTIEGSVNPVKCRQART